MAGAGLFALRLATCDLRLDIVNTADLPD